MLATKIDMPLSEKWFPGCSVPLGAIVCTVTLVDFTRVKRGAAPGQTWAWWDGVNGLDRVPEDEFGDFSLGRFLWKLAAVEAVSPVVRISGRQDLWNWAP